MSNGVGGGFETDPQAIRTQASAVDALGERFAAVRTASASIAQNDAAYGLLCGWMAGVLEGRHVRQDELIALVEENLSVAVAELRGTADDYDAVDEAVADGFRGIRTEPS